MNKDFLVLKTENILTSPYITHATDFLIFEKKTLSEPFPLHRHEFFEIEFITSGNGLMVLNGKNKQLKTGVLYLLRPSDFHEYFPSSPLEIITLTFNFTLLPHFLSDYIAFQGSSFFMELDNPSFKAFLSLLSILQKEYDGDAPFKDYYLKNIISCLLISLFRLSTEQKLEPQSDDIFPALNYLHLNFAESPDLTTVAKIVHLNPSYFSTLFKKKTNKTYTEYLNDLKITHAKRLLKINDLSILDIGMSCGFNSQSNFSRVFHNYVGMSPTEYRILHTTKQESQ